MMLRKIKGFSYVKAKLNDYCLALCGSHSWLIVLLHALVHRHSLLVLQLLSWKV